MSSETSRWRYARAIETFIRREDADQFIARVKRDDPELASHLRVVERELKAGGPN
jgi:hypothetical protein